MTNTALVIIDMQNDHVLPEIYAPNQSTFEILPKLQQLLNHFRSKKQHVFHVIRAYRADGSDVEFMREDSFKKRPRCVPGTHGYEIPTQLAPLSDEYIVTKPRFSAFMGTEFDFLLRRLQIDHLVIAGTQAPNCVRCTIYDAISLEYRVTAIPDAIAARNPEVHTANITDFKNLGVPCLNVQEFIQGN